jgi:hypothetical protein
LSNVVTLCSGCHHDEHREGAYPRRAQRLSHPLPALRERNSRGSSRVLDSRAAPLGMCHQPIRPADQRLRQSQPA